MCRHAIVGHVAEICSLYVTHFPYIGSSRLIWYLRTITCVSTQDFQRRENPKTFQLLCARRRLSVSVRVAHARECWPGSRLAAPVSIWCWQFTQAFFPLLLGVSTHTVSLLRGISHSNRAKNLKALDIQHTLKGYIVKYIRLYMLMDQGRGQQPLLPPPRFHLLQPCTISDTFPTLGASCGHGVRHARPTYPHFLRGALLMRHR